MGNNWKPRYPFKNHAKATPVSLTNIFLAFSWGHGTRTFLAAVFTPLMFYSTNIATENVLLRQRDGLRSHAFSVQSPMYTANNSQCYSREKRLGKDCMVRYLINWLHRGNGGCTSTLFVYSNEYMRHISLENPLISGINLPLWTLYKRNIVCLETRLNASPYYSVRNKWLISYVL